MPEKLPIDRLQIELETLSVPPPYSYHGTFDLQFEAEELKLKYNLQYTHRDELNEPGRRAEEIWEEGFSDDDDFSWEGSLPLVWRDTLADAWQATQLVDENPSESVENGILINARLADGQRLEGIPQRIQEWEYLLQELTQAVYEAAQREYPLRIRYLERSSKSEEKQLFITVRFLDRSIELVHQQKRQSQTDNLPWDKGVSLLKALYQLDFNSEQAHPKMPNQSGKYLDPGDNLWYQLEKDVKNPGKVDYLAKVIATLS